MANTTISESIIKKKCQNITYHLIREGVARDEQRIAYVKSAYNEADLLIIRLPTGKKRRGFVRNLIHYIYRG